MHCGEDSWVPRYMVGSTRIEVPGRLLLWCFHHVELYQACVDYLVRKGLFGVLFEVLSGVFDVVNLPGQISMSPSIFVVFEAVQN